MNYVQSFNPQARDVRRDIVALIVSVLGVGMAASFPGAALATKQNFYLPSPSSAQPPYTASVYVNPCTQKPRPLNTSACISTDPTTPAYPATTVSVSWAQLIVNNPTYTYSSGAADVDKGSVVVAPTTGTLRRPLVVVLGGSLSTPLGYQTLSERAAYDGFQVIDLQYDSNNLPHDACAYTLQGQQAEQDQCQTAWRGASAFGVQSPYDATNTADPIYCPMGSSFFGPSCTAASVTSSGVSNEFNTPTTDSITGRLVTALDQLANQQPQSNGNVLGLSTNTSWAQYLTPNVNSPYKRSDGTGAYPDWSHIILVGHSMGGGSALFIAKHVPVERVIVLSSPEDYTPDYNNASGFGGDCSNLGFSHDGSGNCPAAWIGDVTQYKPTGQSTYVTVNPAWSSPSSYSLSASTIWGLRHGTSATTSDEGAYGQDAEGNWDVIPGFGTTSQLLTDDGYCVYTSTCTGSPDRQRYVLANPAWTTATLYNHNSTGADPQALLSYPSPAVAYIWDHMLLTGLPAN